MSNSPLVVYTKLSPNCNKPRTAKIDTITIHCVVGQVTAERLGDIFAPESRQASSNYGVDKDGRVGMYVEEKNRSWCTSNSSNDNRAVTIEVASDSTHPYMVTDKALSGLINLCADICKRNGIKQLLWKNDKNLIGQVDKQNMTVHMWFANKACPGKYLLDKHDYIASEVNKSLNSNAAETPKQSTFAEYSVKVTAESLNIRKGAGINFGIIAQIKDKGTYVICDESNGTGATKWGKLKNGQGWISLDFCTKVTTSTAKPDVVYTVVKGDNLSKIAKKYGTTSDKLKNYNNIKDANKISVGQKIKIPG